MLVAGALLSAAILLLDAVFYGHTLEDAFITFRYSEHLAEGFGIGAWNTNGERVEGYTSTLWMLWLAVAPKLGLRIETLAKATGVAAHLALCWVFLLVPLRRRDPIAGERDLWLLAAAIPALYLPAAWYATSGMETLPFAFAVALAMLAPLLTERAWLPVLAFATLVLLRPEGILFAIAFGALHWLRARRLVAWPALAGPLAAGVALVALTGFRLATYGQIFPNTYYAKVGGSGTLLLHHGVAYLQDWGWIHLSWIAALIAAGVVCALALLRGRRAEGESLAGLLLLAFVFFGYVLRVGGDNPSALPWWRHLLHLLPVLALLVAAGVVGAVRARALRFALVGLLLALANHGVLAVHGERMRGELRAAMGRYPSLAHLPTPHYDLWLKDLAGPEAVIASPAAGEMPYVVDAIHVDMLGLNDAHIAHMGRFDPTGPVDSKTNVSYVLSREPDFLELPFAASKALEARPDRVPALRRGELSWWFIGHPSFWGEYLLVLDAPEKLAKRALFVRRESWEAHPQRDEIEVIPFVETPLFRYWVAKEGRGGTGKPPSRKPQPPPGYLRPVGPEG